MLARLSQIPRNYYLFAVGWFAVLLGVQAGWYSIPSSAASSFGSASLQLSEHAAIGWEFAVRAGLLCYAGLAVAALRGTVVFRRRVIGAGWLLLLLTLAFPYVMNHWYPEYGLDTRVIYRQVDRVVDDMEAGLNWQHFDWRESRIIMTQMPPDTLSATVFEDEWGVKAALPEYQTHVLQNVLGYSNEFLNSVGKGWIFAILGLILTILPARWLIPVSAEAERSPRLWPMFVVVLAGLLIPKWLAYYYVDQGKTRYAAGNWHEAADDWRRAAFWNPGVDYALPYFADLGEMAQAKECVACPEWPLFELAKAVRTGNYARAEQLAGEPLTQRLVEMPAYRYWLSAVFLEYGVQAFNAGQYGLAEELWNKTLVQMPTSAMAWYGLSLVYLKYKQFERAAEAINQVVALQKFVNFRKMTISGQYWATKSWAAFRRDDPVAAHQLYTKYLTPDSWK